ERADAQRRRPLRQHGHGHLRRRAGAPEEVPAPPHLLHRVHARPRRRRRLVHRRLLLLHGADGGQPDDDADPDPPAVTRRVPARRRARTQDRSSQRTRPHARVLTTLKTLLLLRHGKSDWAADYAGDHERPLKGRGRRDAARVGRFLAAYGPPPDRCLTSTAVRARTTLRLAHEAGGWRAPVEETAELYHAYPETVLSVLARVDDGVGTLLVTGHEPTLSETVARLVAPRSGGAV